MKSYIYTLSDPRNGFVRYVGKTFHLKKRYRSHLRDFDDNTRKSNWVRLLVNLGLKPVMEVIEEIDGDYGWEEAERFWISTFKFYGFNLTNLDSGGCSGKHHSIETKLKIGAKHKGKIISKETRAKISAKNKLWRPTPLQIAKSANSRRGMPKSQAHRAALTGLKRTPEQRARIAASKAGRKRPPNFKEVMKLSWIKRKIKYGLSGGAKPCSDERKAAISKAITNFYREKRKTNQLAFNFRF